MLCRSQHELAHAYEKSGRYGEFMATGTLARAIRAMISDGRAGRDGTARTPVPARPATRLDCRRGRRARKRTGGGAWIGVAVVVGLILIGVNSNRSTQSPAQQQPTLTATPEQAPVTVPVTVPPLPPPPEPYIVQPGDTLEKIARDNGVTVDDLLSWNPSITNPDLIDSGQAVNTKPPTG